MVLDNKEYKLTTKFENCIAEIYLEERKLGEFEIVDEDEIQLDKQEGAEETIEEIRANLAANQS